MNNVEKLTVEERAEVIERFFRLVKTTTIQEFLRKLKGLIIPFSLFLKLLQIR
jgi:hypothetical protein